MVGSTKNTGSGHLLWPKWASSIEEVPSDLIFVIEYAQKIYSWYENLPEKEIQVLLQKWKSARQNKAVAYLTQALEFIPTQFSNRDNQMVESQANMAT